MNGMLQRWEEVRARIAAATARAGRPADAVRLVAVSKTHPAGAVAELFSCGQADFGESRVQELLAKAPTLPSAVRWHFIGHLQKNKIRKILPLACLIHGVDSAALAGEIDRVADEGGLFPEVLLEVNVSGEATKFGFQPEALRRELDGLLRLPRIQVTGLMTMAPYAEDPEKARPTFVALRELREALAAEFGIRLDVLSMGMSGDYEVAIEEGATLVRVGTAIFGARPTAEA